MRVAVVAETFRPVVNGVSNSVVRVVEHLTAGGHDALVVAPAAGPGQPGPDRYGAVPVVRVRSVRVPMYRSVPIARPGVALDGVLAEFGPDVVHLASPVVLGWAGAVAAQRLGVPAVAAFQTDLAAFLGRYHLPAAAPLVWRHLRSLHQRCALTLAPSTASAWQLARHGIGPVVPWPRGVDPEVFAPRHRSAALRRRLAPGGELIVGYVGRLAREKRVHLLAPLTRLPGVVLVVVGDGPRRDWLARQLPGAVFLGFRTGAELSTVYASLDLFVHPGADETFCQSVQESLASGVPVIASAAGGPLDLVRHGGNGWLWSGEDPRVLRAQVADLAADRATLAALRRQARSSVLGRTWQQVGEQLLRYYRRVGAPTATTRATPPQSGGLEVGRALAAANRR